MFPVDHSRRAIFIIDGASLPANRRDFHSRDGTIVFKLPISDPAGQRSLAVLKFDYLTSPGVSNCVFRNSCTGSN